MRVGLYMDVCLRPAPTGIGRHVLGLIEALAELDAELELVLYHTWSFRDRARWPAALRALCGRGSARARLVPFPTRWTDDRPSLWWDQVLPVLLRVDGVQVFHGANHRVPCIARARRRWKNVVTVHDLAFAYMPVHGPGLDGFLLRQTLAALQHSDRVICVSEATARDCAELAECDEGDLQVIYQGFERQDPGQPARPERLHGTRPFALMVGGLHPRKNIPNLVEAFAAVVRETDLDLVIAGGDGPDGPAVRQRIASPDLAGRVHLLGYVSDAERAWLYANAMMTVYPSRYEGFGLVVLEAMSAGSPVITSTVSAMPEAAGDAALLVSPDDHLALSDAIGRLAGDESLREQLRQRGHAQLARFRWRDCAAQTLDAYRTALYGGAHAEV